MHSIVKLNPLSLAYLLLDVWPWTHFMSLKLLWQMRIIIASSLAWCGLWSVLNIVLAIQSVPNNCSELTLCGGWADRQAEDKNLCPHTGVHRTQESIQVALSEGREGKWGDGCFRAVTSQGGFERWVGALERMIKGLQKNILMEVTACAKWRVEKLGLVKGATKVVGVAGVHTAGGKAAGMASWAYDLGGHTGPPAPRAPCFG